MFITPFILLDVESVEKVPKQILGRDAEKSDLIECATINDLMLGKGQVTPENIVLTPQKDFSYRLVMVPRLFHGSHDTVSFATKPFHFHDP
jgi:hypothetical protein